MSSQLVILSGDLLWQQQLLKNGDKKILSENKDGLLQLAAFSGNIECVTALIEQYGADKNIVDYTGRTLIHYAAEGGNGDCLFALIDKYGLDYHAVTKKGRNIAHLMAKNNSLATLVAVLQKYNFDKNTKDADGNGLLHFAALSGDKEYLISVIEKLSFAPTMSNDFGDTIANWATSCNSEDFFALLEKYNLDKNFKGPQGHFITQSIAYECNQKLLSDFIEKYKIDLSKPPDGITVAHYAAGRGNLNFLFTLMDKYGFDKNIKTDIGANLAHYAAESGDENTLFAIIEKYGLDPRAVDKFDRNIAHFAAMTGDLSFLKSVLKKYPELENTVTNDGRSVQSFYDKNCLTCIQSTRLSSLEGLEWQASLVKLKLLYDRKIPDAQAAYSEAVEFHMSRLKRQLTTENSADAIKTLESLVEKNIKEAEIVLHQHRGPQAFQEALKLITKIKSTNRSLFSRLNLRLLRKDLLDSLEKAAKFGVVSAYFQLGELFATGFAGEADLEKAFAYYYTGAKLDDRQCLQAFKVAEHKASESKEMAFFGNLYQGIYFKNPHFLEEAQKLESKTFELMAKKMQGQIDISRQVQTMLLAMAMMHTPESSELKKLQIATIKDECKKITSKSDALIYARELKQSLNRARFLDVTIEICDSLAVSMQCRSALLLIVQDDKMSEEQAKIISSHFKAIPKFTLDEWAIPPTNPVVSSSSNSSEGKLNPTTITNIQTVIKQEVQKLEDAKINGDAMRSVLNWVLQFPYDESDYQQFNLANEMRRILIDTNCDLLFYLQSPKSLSQSIINPLQIDEALSVIKSTLKALIAAVPAASVVAASCRYNPALSQAELMVSQLSSIHAPIDILNAPDVPVNNLPVASAPEMELG